MGGAKKRGDGEKNGGERAPPFCILPILCCYPLTLAVFHTLLAALAAQVLGAL